MTHGDDPALSCPRVFAVQAVVNPVAMHKRRPRAAEALRARLAAAGVRVKLDAFRAEPAGSSPYEMKGVPCA
jgi:hypothetical protein